jgi:hypothetical protein
LIKDTKVVMGVCIPRSLKEKIDYIRGDIPRSKYISKILERAHNNENEIDSDSVITSISTGGINE